MDYVMTFAGFMLKSQLNPVGTFIIDTLNEDTSNVIKEQDTSNVIKEQDTSSVIKEQA